MKNPELKTVSGDPIFPIGIGTWGFGGAWEAVYGEEDKCVEAIHYAVSKGQNHIDSAEIYGAGHTEEVIGQAIRSLDRKKLFITDKLWETHVGEGKAEKAVMAMLERLETDYLDVLYIHKPWEDWPWLEAVPQINELIDKGLVRHFGVSNFNVDQMKQAAKISKHPIVANQLHYNLLYRQEVTAEMQAYCREQAIQIIAWKPLERGEVLKNEVVKAVARARQATPSQIALAWLLSQGVFPIPMAKETDQIDQNLAAVNITLSKQELSQLDGII